MDDSPVVRSLLRPALCLAAVLSLWTAPMATSAPSNDLTQPRTKVESSKKESTQFVPEDHKGMVCMALAPQCMTKKQWAAYCLSQSKEGSILDPDQASSLLTSKSCRDALEDSEPQPTDQSEPDQP